MKIAASRLLVCIVVWLFILSAQANDVDRGQLLYENHCQTCHTPDIHNRDNRKVNSLVELNKMVIRWQYHLKLMWNTTDVSQVTSYVNRRYYEISPLP